jgi:hypothetical protein
MSDNILKFGTEIECLLRQNTQEYSKKTPREQYHLAAGSINHVLKPKNSFEKIKVHGEGNRTRSKYDSWYLKEDASLEPRKGMF